MTAPTTFTFTQRDLEVVIKGLESGDTAHYTQALIVLRRAQPDPVKPIARIMNWIDQPDMPMPHDGICARTYSEYPESKPDEKRYWAEGAPLFTALTTSGTKDNDIANAVSKITEVAKEFHAHESLRQRISQLVVGLFNGGKDAQS